MTFALLARVWMVLKYESGCLEVLECSSSWILLLHNHHLTNGSCCQFKFLSFTLKATIECCVSWSTSQTYCVRFPPHPSALLSVTRYYTTNPWISFSDILYTSRYILYWMAQDMTYLKGFFFFKKEKRFCFNCHFYFCDNGFRRTAHIEQKWRKTVMLQWTWFF